MDKDLENFNPGGNSSSMDDLMPSFNLFNKQPQQDVSEKSTKEQQDGEQNSGEQNSTEDNSGSSTEIPSETKDDANEEETKINEGSTQEQISGSESSDDGSSEVKDALSLLAEDLLSDTEGTDDKDIQQQSEKVEDAKEQVDVNPTEENKANLSDEINRLKRMLADKDIDLQDKDITIEAYKEKSLEKDTSNRKLQSVLDENKFLIESDPETKKMFKDILDFQGGDDTKISSVKEYLSPLIEKIYGVSVDSLLSEKANAQENQASMLGAGGSAEAQGGEGGSGFSIFGGLT